MQQTNTLTRHLDWYNMILLWDKRYEYINPISKRMPLYITTLLIGSIISSALITGFYNYYMSIKDLYAASMFFSLCILFAGGSIASYIFFQRKKRSNLIRTIKAIDRDLIEDTRDRTEYWIAGFITHKKLESIDMWHELSSCYSLLIAAEYSPRHAQSPELFKQYLDTLVTQTEQITRNKENAYDTGKTGIVAKAFTYLDMLYKVTGEEFTDLRNRIGTLRR